MIMKTTVKDVFESDNWMINNILQGFRGKIRIDAKTRFHKADEKNFFSEWCTKKYADRLAIENYGKRTDKFNCWKY